MLSECRKYDSAHGIFQWQKRENAINEIARQVEDYITWKHVPLPLRKITSQYICCHYTQGEIKTLAISYKFSRNYGINFTFALEKLQVKLCHCSSFSSDDQIQILQQLASFRWASTDAVIIFRWIVIHLDFCSVIIILGI